MFLYWPMVGLIAVLVLLTAVLVLKVGDKLCRARIRTMKPKTTTNFSQQPADDLELAAAGGDWGNYLQDDEELQGEMLQGPDMESRLSYYTPSEHASQGGGPHREVSL